MKTKKLLAVLSLALGAVLALPAWAQNTAPSNDDSFTKYGQEFKGKIGRTYAESVEWYPEQVKPKPGTPNVFIIYLDDVGFAQYGCFGGLIKTPNIDALAADGLRYNNFHTPALCSPSRAALMAGRNTHKIGLGSHALTAMGFPGYNGTPPESAKSSPSISSTPALKPSRWANGITRLCRKLRKAAPFNIGPAARASTIIMDSWRRMRTTSARCSSTIITRRRHGWARRIIT